MEIGINEGNGSELINFSVNNNINIPVLIAFGDIDECVLTKDIKIVKKYLNNNIANCNIEIIKGVDHSYTNRYEELGETTFETK